MTTFPSVCGGYGIRGDKGEPGQGIFFQGPWDASESYIPGDMVTDDDGIFIAVEEIAPGTPPGEDASWRLLVLWSEITGPPGPPGPSFVHIQLSAASVWSVTHNLGYYPAITVIDTDGHVVYADIQHTSINNAVITFPVPTLGTASCT